MVDAAAPESSAPEPEEPLVEVEPTQEITYDEQRYPARPKRLRPRAQLRGSGSRLTDPRAADGSNPSYVQWLVGQSMLSDADVLSRQLSGQPSMWRNPYARPDARRAITQRVGVVHRVPDLARHPSRGVVPRGAR